MKQAILADRLYIPVEYVNYKVQNNLANLFTHEVERYISPGFCSACNVEHEYEPPCEEGENCPYKIKKLFMYEKEIFKGKKTIAIWRGNLPLINKLFGKDFSIRDKRATPAATTQRPIKFNKDFKLYTYQKEAIRKWAGSGFGGMIHAPARSGKTALGAYITARLGLKTLILCHQTELVDQFYATFKKFTDGTTVSKFKPKPRVVRAKGGNIVDLVEQDIDVILSTYQTFISVKGQQRLEAVRNSFGLLIVDECFPKNTQIMIDYNHSVSIQEIYQNDKIAHVLSYNLKTKRIEQQKIISKSKRKARRSEKGIIIYIRKTKILLTANHKVYVRYKGYVQAKDLCVGDEVIIYDNLHPIKSGVCDIYGEIVSKKYNIGHHKIRHTMEEGEICPYCNKKFGQLSGHTKFCLKGPNPEEAKKNKKEASERVRAWSKVFHASEAGAAFRKRASTRMLTNNPSHIPGVMERVGKKISATFWAKPKKERDIIITRFTNAPKHTAKPNQKEKIIINLNIRNLEFTGDGKYWVTFLKDAEGRRQNKNPDFIYVPFKCGTCASLERCRRLKGIRINTNRCSKWKKCPTYRTNKVIEVMDFEYWHTRKEAKIIKAQYAALGIQCLVITARFKQKHSHKLQSTIEAFINNSYRPITKLEDYTFTAKNKHLYNLQIAKNSNYFATAVLPNPNKKKPGGGNTNYYAEGTVARPLLVSNCHLVGSKGFSNVVTKLNCFLKAGLTATPNRKDGRDILAKYAVGPVVSYITPPQLVGKSYMMSTNISPGQWSHWPTLISRLVKSKTRNKMIVSTALKDLKLGRNIIMLTDRRKHAEVLVNMLKDAGAKKVFLYYAGLPNAKAILKKARLGKTNVLVATRKKAQFGLDIPPLDTYYCLTPINNAPNFYQEFSRIRTPYENKYDPLVRVFVDKAGACRGCAKTCEKVLREQGFSIGYGRATYGKIKHALETDASGYTRSPMWNKFSILPE